MSSTAPEAVTVAALASVAEHDQGQRRITAVAEAAVRRLWRRMRGRRWSTAWANDVGPQVSEVIARSQAAAVAETARYATSVLGDLGMPTANPNPINPDGFAGLTGDGLPVEDRAYSAVLATVDSYYSAREAGADDTQASRTALLDGEEYLASVAAEILADAMRAAEGVSLSSRPWVDGFIRSAEPGACSRCIVLAGKFFLYNEGFQRHPKCRCNHLPAPPGKAERDALYAASAPSRYFEALTEAEQDATFGRAAADAIRAGADIAQVVNARRGMSTAQDSLGRRRLVRNRSGLYVTTEGTTRRGFAGRRLREEGRQVRLMPESIAELAGDDRDEYIRLLRANGFIL